MHFRMFAVNMVATWPIIKSGISPTVAYNCFLWQWKQTTDSSFISLLQHAGTARIMFINNRYCTVSIISTVYTTFVPSVLAASAPLFEILPRTALGRPAVGLTAALRSTIDSVLSRFLKRLVVCQQPKANQQMNINWTKPLILIHHTLHCQIHIRWPLCTNRVISTAAWAVAENSSTAHQCQNNSATHHLWINDSVAIACYTWNICHTFKQSLQLLQH